MNSINKRENNHGEVSIFSQSGERKVNCESSDYFQYVSTAWERLSLHVFHPRGVYVFFVCCTAAYDQLHAFFSALWSQSADSKVIVFVSVYLFVFVWQRLLNGNPHTSNHFTFMCVYTCGFESLCLLFNLFCVFFHIPIIRMIFTFTGHLYHFTVFLFKDFIRF